MLEVNDCLKVKCSLYALGFIDNSNVTKVRLNQIGLHLTFKCTVTLAKNVVTYPRLKRIIHVQSVCFL